MIAAGSPLVPLPACRPSERADAPEARRADRAWTSLVEANRLLTMAEEMAHVGHWQFDQISGQGFFSDEARRIFGFAEGQRLTREPVLAAYHPDDRERVTTLLAAHVAGGTRFEYPARVVRPDGEVRAVLVRGRCDRDAAGTSVVTFGTVLDVTEMRRTEQRLEETGALLTTTLDAMDQGLMMVDGRGRVVVANRRVAELLGLDPALLAGRPHYAAMPGAPAEAGGCAAGEAALRARTGDLDPPVPIREHVRPDGVVLEVRSVPLADGGVLRTYTDITERKQHEHRIAHMARHDALTDLPNRTLFHERLTQRLQEVRDEGRDEVRDPVGGPSGCAVLCLDLDRFKAVNDVYGHLAGDALLREIAHRLRSVVRAEDTVARLGGDEFAVLVAQVEEVDTVAQLATRLIAAVQVPVRLGNQSIEVGLSVGIALAQDGGLEGGLDGEAVFKRADLALYQAKADGRGTYRTFQAGMNDQAAERRSLERDLRLAIAAGELALHYQPQIRSATGEVVGFEALVRWTHPTRGSIQPATFVGLAEDAGLIGALGEWVLRAACREAAGWARPLKVAVNLSPRQFAQLDLPERVLAILTETGLSPSRLELEITETVIINDVSRALAILRRLKGFGIRISMDDFGTGYSSLATLQAFPFDKIKIDRAFVGGMETSSQATAIVSAVLGLGRSLGMGVVAEGVETPEQMRFLAEAACDEAQGYLIGRPQPIEAFADIVREPPRPGQERDEARRTPPVALPVGRRGAA